MVRHGLKHIFQKPTPDIDSSDRTQQLRSKTIYAGTVDLAHNLVKGNGRYKTYNGPYEVVNQAGNSNLIASRSYDDLLSITKGKVLLNQLPLNNTTQKYYQKNFSNGQIYEGNYNQFDPEYNFSGPTGTACENTVMVYDIGVTGFTGPESYNVNGGFVGATGPQYQESVSYIGFGDYAGTTVASGSEQNNKYIFIDPNHCYYSDPCLQDASYTRFVTPVLSGLTGPGNFTAQQIINVDQYRGFSYPMSNFNLTCIQQLSNQSVGPIFCSARYELNVLNTTFPINMYTIQYFTSGGLEISNPQVNGFTVYKFGNSGTVPIDTAVTRTVTHKGSVPLDIHYAVVGGGGGGGSSFYYDDSLLPASSSGGGGGGFFYSTFPSLPQVQLLSGVSYTVAVGGGGSAGSIAGPNGQPGQNGKDSVINFESGSKTGYGGGGGATATTSGGTVGAGNNGNNNQGNGGGGAGSTTGSGSAGTGTFAGGPGSSSYAGAGGGGGMTQVGGGVSGQVSKGGDGISNSISGITQYFGAGGGGGAAFNNAVDDNFGVGGVGGGGNGGWWNTNYNLVQAQNGANVYGSGGGGAYSVLPPVSPFTRSSVPGANGGSGSVWIRFNSYTILN